MIHPNFTLLFVEDTRRSTDFYRDLLGIEPVETSDTFSMFVLNGGLKLGFWSRHTAEPKVSVTGGGAELAFQLGSDEEVDRWYNDWKARGLRILQQPTSMDFGHTFVATDPDGHRLRVYAFHD